MNFIRKILSGFILIGFLFLTACYPASQTDSFIPTNHLVVYEHPIYNEIISQAVTLYKENYPEVEVEYHTFSDLQEYWTTIQTELMAGKGPDLLLFTEYDLPDLYKNMDSDAFYDIDKFMEQDVEFDQTDMNTNVFNSGYYKGKRLYIPLHYLTYSAFTTAEAMEDFDFSLSETPSFQEFANAVLDWTQSHSPEELKKLIYCEAGSTQTFADIFGLTLYDPVTKELQIETPAFQECIQLFKALYPLMNPEAQRLEKSVLHCIRDRDILFFAFSSHQPREIDFFNSYTNLNTNEKIVSIPIPSVGSGQPTAFPVIMAAITNSGVNKSNAYDLLKLCLSEPVQEKQWTPVNNKVAAKNLREIGVSEEEIEKHLAALQNVHAVPNASLAVMDILVDTMLPWFQNEQGYDECLAELKNRLEIYINE